jgi:hypothetical protein
VPNQNEGNAFCNQKDGVGCGYSTDHPDQRKRD